MSSKNYEGSGYRQDLDLLIILYQLHISYSTRSGWREKCLLRPNYCMWDGLADIKRTPWLCGLADYFIFISFMLS